MKNVKQRFILAFYMAFLIAVPFLCKDAGFTMTVAIVCFVITSIIVAVLLRLTKDQKKPDSN
jgi:hypothetical protein